MDEPLDDTPSYSSSAAPIDSLVHSYNRKVIVKESSPDFIAKESIPHLSELIDLTSVAVSARFSIKTSMSPVRDQQDGGFCCSFAVAACVEFSNGKIDVSESHLNDGAERKYDNCKEGLAIDTAMQFCVVEGVVRETNWPYDPHQ